MYTHIYLQIYVLQNIGVWSLKFKQCLRLTGKQGQCQMKAPASKSTPFSTKIRHFKCQPKKTLYVHNTCIIIAIYGIFCCSIFFYLLLLLRSLTLHIISLKEIGHVRGTFPLYTYIPELIVKQYWGLVQYLAAFSLSQPPALRLGTHTPWKLYILSVKIIAKYSQLLQTHDINPRDFQYKH